MMGEDFNNGFFVIRLPWQDLDDIIGNALEGMDYEIQRNEYHRGASYIISDGRGRIARFSTSALTGKLFESDWFSDDYAAETKRVQKEILFAIWKQQNANDDKS